MEEKISIKIHCCSEVSLKNDLEEILYGIEEEGLPFAVQTKEERDSVTLGIEASRSSRLDVGIGIGTDGITLYHEKLCSYRPALWCPLPSSKEVLRAMGMNGARLIKGEPLVLQEEEII